MRGMGKGTNKCLVRQLLCLYPFPQVSHLSSTRLNFLLPSLTRGWPSLARRMRAFCMLFSPSSPDALFGSSSIAFSLTSILPSKWNFCVGRLAGGEGRLPTIAARAAALFDVVLRRELTAIGVTLSPPTSLIAAAMAAAFAAVFVMDFRRVTRWLALRAPLRMEWELVREWDCRVVSPEEEADESDGRCWFNGLVVCCIS